MTASKIFLYFCLSFVLGIFIASLIKFSQPIMLGILVFGLILISVFWKHPEGPRPQIEGGACGASKKIAVFGFCVLFLTFGVWRYQAIETKISESKLQIYNDGKEKITLIGVISEEPDVKEKSVKLKVESEKLEVNGKSINISGEILVTARRYPEYRYGDKLRIIGKLEAPSADINGFNYEEYLKKDGIYSVMSWPEIELLGKGFGNPVMNILFSFKDKFKETAQKFVPPLQEGFLEALVFGDENNISQDWKDKLNFTGTRHIAAVSGMNITIISALILNFLLALGFWRNQAFYLAIILLILYILMIGAPASAVRAGIMGGLLMTAQHFGRMSAASRAVVFASAAMLFLNPLLLRLDVGFQLSFLAIIGLISLQPVFSEFLKKIPNPKYFPLRSTLAATLSAQVFTLPVLIYNFGYFSLLAPLTNILIVPFLAPITIMIFIFGFCGMIFYPLGFVLSLPVWLCLVYLTKIIDIFSKIPFVFLKLENVNWIILAVFYLILIIITWRLQERQKLNFLKY